MLVLFHNSVYVCVCVRVLILTTRLQSSYNASTGLSPLSFLYQNVNKYRDLPAAGFKYTTSQLVLIQNGRFREFMSRQRFYVLCLCSTEFICFFHYILQWLKFSQIIRRKKCALGTKTDIKYKYLPKLINIII